MVLGFFKSDDGLDEVSVHIQSMLTDARHSFDLAMSAVLAGAVMRMKVSSTTCRLVPG